MNSAVQDPQARLAAIYHDISQGLVAASGEIEGLTVNHEAGKRAIADILQQLGEMKANFESELALLERHVEWDHFTIAFFGETNAGKSTLIESLRILFDEESRRELLRKNAGDLAATENELKEHAQRVSKAMYETQAGYLLQFSHVEQAIGQLTDTLRGAAASRARRLVCAAALAGFAVGVIAVLVVLPHH